MTANKGFLQINAGLYTFILFFAAPCMAEEEQDLSVEVGAEYEYSDNIYKVSDDEITGNTTSADLQLGYTKSLATTNITLNYSAQYSKESEEDLEDSDYWVGTAAVSQQVFSKNLLLNLNHSRKRYIVDQDKVALESNTNEQDVLSGNLQWTIPYSQRTSFTLSAGHSQTWYQDDDTNNYNTNTGSTSWQYLLSNKSQVQLAYTGSKKDFDDYDNTYTEHNLDASYTRQYVLGSYSFNIGQNWIKSDNDTYTNNNYGFTVDALVDQHLFSFNTSYTLTNTADQIGTDNSLDNSGYAVYRQTNVSLQYQYQTANERLGNSLLLYYIDDKEIESTSSADDDDQEQYGISGELSWLLTKKLSNSLSANYYQVRPTDGNDKHYTEVEIGARYDFTPSVYIQFTAALEKQNYTQSTADYDEQLYTTRIAVTY